MNNNFSEAYNKLQKLDEMAYNKNYAIKLISSDVEGFFEHFLKCMIYKNRYNCLTHWYDEMADFLVDMNKFNLKTKASRLSKQEYENTFYDVCGEDKNDMSLAIGSALWLFRKKYDKITRTETLISNCYDTYHKLVDKLSSIMSVKNEFTKEDFYNIIKQYLGENNETN